MKNLKLPSGLLFTSILILFLQSCTDEGYIKADQDCQTNCYIFSGKVVDENGNPVSNVDVHFLHMVVNYAYDPITEIGKDRTDNNGDYRISVIITSSQFSEGGFSMNVDASGFKSYSQGVNGIDSTMIDIDRGVNITLEPL